MYLLWRNGKWLGDSLCRKGMLLDCFSYHRTSRYAGTKAVLTIRHCLHCTTEPWIPTARRSGWQPSPTGVSCAELRVDGISETEACSKGSSVCWKCIGSIQLSPDIGEYELCYLQEEETTYEGICSQVKSKESMSPSCRVMNSLFSAASARFSSLQKAFSSNA